MSGFILNGRNAVLLLLVCFYATSCTCAPTKCQSAGSKKPAATQCLRKVRTTAYTHTKSGGCKNAMGQRLAHSTVASASADWSRFPLGTQFRIVSTGQLFEVDDYGSALVGTDTIDLYQTTRTAMNNWGARSVDIEILSWGSRARSLSVLQPRAGNRSVRTMIAALREPI